MRFLIIILLFTACTKPNVKSYYLAKVGPYYSASFYQNRYNYLDLYLSDGKAHKLIGWRVEGSLLNVINTTYIDDSYYIDSIIYK